MRLEWLLSRFLGGHITIGPVTIYGRNAMHWAINVHTRRWGYVCVRLPLRCFGRWWPLYLYASPNGTPWAATFMLGGGVHRRSDRRLAPTRRRLLGHNFHASDDAVYEALQHINAER